MNLKIRRIIFIVLIIINCITIFIFSNQNGDDSTKTSDFVTDFIVNIISNINKMGDNEKITLAAQMSPYVRKIAHYSIYFILGFLSMNYMNTFRGRGFYQKELVSFLLCVFYAITDEIHQLFINERAGQITDVYIDSLGALTGIFVAIFIIVAIRKKLKIKEKYKISKDTKILFISSTGGHFNELMQLKPIMNKCNYHIVTEITDTNRNLKEKYKDKIDYLPYGTKRTPFKYLFILLGNSLKSLYIYLKVRPQVIITTGTHTAGPMCCIGKILGSKVIYIETFANRTSKTEAGKLLYYVADTFVVQWEDMLKVYPKAKYWGWIF